MKMEAEQLFDQKIQQIRSQSNVYQQRISRDMEILNQLTDTSKIKEQAQNVALRIVSDRRTIYVATGIILSYLIIRLLVGRRTTKVIKTKGTAGGNITLTNKKPSLLVQIVQMAIQTLILHYVRKVLKEMLEPVKQTSKANSSTQT